MVNYYLLVRICFQKYICSKEENRIEQRKLSCNIQIPILHIQED